MDDMGKTDIEFRQRQAAALSNVIINCMRTDGMTLQNLDEAVVIVEDVYRKNATMKDCK